MELGYARAHELLMRLGSDMPLWSGVITVQHEYLSRWGALPRTNTTASFTQIRALMNAHTRVIWKNRCEIVYSPENEKKKSRQPTQERSHDRHIKYGSGVKGNRRRDVTHDTKTKGKNATTSRRRVGRSGTTTHPTADDRIHDSNTKKERNQERTQTMHSTPSSNLATNNN